LAFIYCIFSNQNFIDINFWHQNILYLYYDIYTAMFKNMPQQKKNNNNQIDCDDLLLSLSTTQPLNQDTVLTGSEGY
jgi:hypothetical protein